MSCYVMFCYIILCYVMLCYDLLCYVMLWCVTVHYITSCYVMFYYIMMCHILWYVKLYHNMMLIWYIKMQQNIMWCLCYKSLLINSWKWKILILSPKCFCTENILRYALVSFLIFEVLRVSENEIWCVVYFDYTIKYDIMLPTYYLVLRIAYHSILYWNIVYCCLIYHEMLKVKFLQSNHFFR